VNHGPHQSKMPTHVMPTPMKKGIVSKAGAVQKARDDHAVKKVLPTPMKKDLLAKAAQVKPKPVMASMKTPMRKVRIDHQLNLQ